MSAGPKSWGELLQQYEKQRIQPPPPDAYVKQRIVKHEDAGIFSDTSSTGADTSVMCDTRLYSTDQVFAPEEPAKPRRPAIQRDHGFEIFAWPKRQPRAEPERPPQLQKTSTTVRDFNLLTGAPLESPFKATVKQVIEQRAQARNASMRRKDDPISNTFPTSELEAMRTAQEAKQREAVVTHHLQMMPETERRAHSRVFDIISGETRDEATAKKMTNDFPNSTIGRGLAKLAREQKIVEGRERDRIRDEDRVACRYNNGRVNELRNYDIVTERPTFPTLDKSVRNKPSIWQWCQTEKLEVH